MVMWSFLPFAFHVYAMLNLSMSNNSRAVRAKPLQCVSISRALLLVINAMNQSEKCMEHVGWSGALPKFVALKLGQIYRNFTFLPHNFGAAKRYTSTFVHWIFD